MVRLLAIVCALLAIAASATAQTLVYALETGRDVMCSGGGCHPPTIHLFSVNGATARELATATLGAIGNRGTAVELSSNGTRLLVTTVSSGSPGRLWIVDAVNLTVLGQLPLGEVPSDIAILPDSSRAYVVGSGSVSVVDLATLTVTATIPFQSSPSRSVVSPTGSAVYVTVPQSATVAKISTATNSVETTIAVGPSPSGIDISPDGSRIFVANNGNATVSVIDANLDSVLRVIPAGSSSTPPVDVAAQSATRVFVALSGVAFPAQAEVQLLNAADGALVGASVIGNGGRFARDASGSPVYLVETAGSALRQIAADASSSTTVATAASPPGAGWNAAAVFTDPCAFGSTVTPAAFGPAGGSGTLTIAAPAGCAWAIDTSSADAAFSVAGPLNGTGPATRTVSVSGGDTPKLGTIVIGYQALTLERTIPRMNIETPAGDAVLQQPFTIGGWAIDQNLVPTTSVARSRGVDFLHVWAYPASGAPPVFLGTASPGGFRPDVAVIFGMPFCGFNFTVTGLATGRYTIVAFAHSEISNSFVTAQAVAVTVTSPPPVLVVDTPATGSTMTGTFDVGGWAIDPAAPSGSGVDTIHIWAYPVSEASPMFVGAATPSQRPDVSAFFNNPNFLDSGFVLRGATLPPGTYDLVVFARSTVTNTFNNSKVVRITVR